MLHLSIINNMYRRVRKMKNTLEKSLESGSLCDAKVFTIVSFPDVSVHVKTWSRKLLSV